MLPKRRTCTDSEITFLLRSHGVYPTVQRIAVAHAFFSDCRHLAAEELFRLLKARGVQVSKATVYNTLNVMAERGIVRAVIADPNRVFFDPNISPHHHFYNEVSGELIDVDASEVQVLGLPALPEGSELQGVDVIIRVRPRSEAASAS